MGMCPWLFQTRTLFVTPPFGRILIPCTRLATRSRRAKFIHRIHNGAQNTSSRLDRLLLLSFAGQLHLSKAASGMSFSARTTAVEFEVAFAILQVCIRAKKGRSWLSSLDLIFNLTLGIQCIACRACPT